MSTVKKEIRFKAALFDMDGVLVDSLPLHIKSWQHSFSPYGVEIEPLEVLLNEGEKAAITARKIACDRGLELSEDDFRQLLKSKRDYYGENAPKGLIGEAIALVRELKLKGYKLALVTGSIRKNLLRVMTAEEIGLFDCIITSELVDNSKPHPEPYLRAAKAMGVEPADCLVVENAPLGIRSAKAARMRVAAITSTLSSDYLKDADWVVDRWDEISSIINNFG